jgi:hypothetical protein
VAVYVFERDVEWVEENPNQSGCFDVGPEKTHRLLIEHDVGALNLVALENPEMARFDWNE